MPLGFCPGEGRRFAALVERLREIPDWARVARSVGILRVTGEERLADRLIIWEVRAGQPVFYTARTITGQGVRYLGAPNLVRPVLGWETLERPTSRVIVAEGPFDVLPLQAAGESAVALLGDRLGDPGPLLAAVGSRTLVLALDADEAGDRGSAILQEEALRRGLRVMRCRPPTKDLAEWIVRDGVPAVQDALGGV